MSAVPTWESKSSSGDKILEVGEVKVLGLGMLKR